MSLFVLEKDQVNWKTAARLLGYYGGLKMREICSNAYLIDLLSRNKKVDYIIEDNFVHFVYKDSLICVPFGDAAVSKPSSCIRFMQKNNLKEILYVPSTSSWLENIDVFGKYFELVESKSLGSEYVYDNEVMDKCDGGDWRNFRNKRNKFHNKFIETKIVEIVPYKESMYDDAIVAYNAWYETLGKVLIGRGEKIWDTEFYKFCLKSFDSMKTKFFIVRDIEKNIAIGSVAFSVINSDLSYGLFRKLSPEYTNIAQYMQWWQANHLWNNMGIRYLNDGYDSADAGLKALKSGFKPVLDYKIYSLILKYKYRGDK